MTKAAYKSLISEKVGGGGQNIIFPAISSFLLILMCHLLSYFGTVKSIRRLQIVSKGVLSLLKMVGTDSITPHTLEGEKG